MKKTLTIATRESELALWQTKHIKGKLLSFYPDYTISILGLTTKGDQILDKTLSKIGGKGLFVKELEQALLDGRADLAVHSLKDVPMILPEEFSLVAITERENPLDAFISNHYETLAQLPKNAVVGTSSLRREAQIRAKYPHIKVKPLRGNLQTRLAKLDAGQYDAIILAASGLIRLGLNQRIRCVLTDEESLPAAGQGALAIEIAANRQDLIEILHVLNHQPTRLCVTAERAVSRELGGSCQVPLAAFATLDENMLSVRAMLSVPDGKTVIRGQICGNANKAESLGLSVAQQLIEQGALHMIAQITHESQQ